MRAEIARACRARESASARLAQGERERELTLSGTRVRLSPPREPKDQERAFTSRESLGESMAAVGVRRNDKQDAMRIYDGSACVR